MTSWRRYVIEIGHHFYFLPCALVQSMIPPNLVWISQQTKKFIALQICALKWRNDVTTSLRHRKWSPFLLLTMRLGPIYDPSKFGWDISRDKKVYCFASSVVGVVVGWGSSNVFFSYILLSGVVRFSGRCFDTVGVSFRVGRPCQVVNISRKNLIGLLRRP